MGTPGMLLLPILIPLLGAVLIAMCDSKPNLREAVTLTTAVVLFLIVLRLLGSDAFWHRAANGRRCIIDTCGLKGLKVC